MANITRPTVVKRENHSRCRRTFRDDYRRTRPVVGDVERCEAHGIIMLLKRDSWGSTVVVDLHPVFNPFRHRRAVVALREEAKDAES